MTKVRKAIVLSVLGLFVCIPSALAISGINMDDVRVKLYTEQGGDWFRALTMDTDDDGVVEVEGVLPGWYKIRVDKDDEEDVQYVAVKLRMRDTEGREIKEATPVDLYVRIDDVSTFIGTVETDKKGWIELENLSLDTEYKLDISKKEGTSVDGKDGRARVKVNAKIADSEWFRAYYERTDNAYTLHAKGVLPGKYEYKYKSGDRDMNLPFNLYVKLLDEKGEKIDEPTPVNLYAYVGPTKAKTLIGQVMTDDKGKVFIPGVMTEMKYSFEVVNENLGYMNR